MGIYTHNCVGTNDVDRAGHFYDAALGPLGIVRLGDFLDQGLAYGNRAAEFLVLRPIDGSNADPGNGATIGFKAPSRAAVDAFHIAGLASGGSDEGAPGPRGEDGFYAGYFRDPDGNKLNAFCMVAAAGDGS